MSATIRLLFFASIFLSAAIRSAAQDFIIDHDLQNGKTSYFRVARQRDTVKVKAISAKKQAHITLTVDNYNPFYWNAKVTSIKRPVDEEASNAGAFNPFSFLGKGLGGVVKDILPDLDLGKVGGRGGKEPQEINSKYIYHVAIYQQLYARYAGMAEKAEDMQLLRLHLEELKFDIRKSGEEIKRNAQDAVTGTLGKNELTWENAMATGRRLNKELVNISDSLASEKRKLDELRTGVDESTTTDDGLTLEEVSARINDNSKKLSSQPSLNSQLDFAHELSQIADVYHQIQNAKYEFTYSVNGPGDISQLKLQLYPRSDSLGKDTITKFFPIESRGNIRIRNSVGVAFTHFADKNKSYYVNPDTTIGCGSADMFTPVLNTFISFYPVSSRSVKFGGSIGFGIPISGEKKDINYMLGVSAFIGNNEPIIITAGVAGTNVTMLADGWKPGDKVPDTDYALPKVSVFRAGYFLSVSFNLSGLAGKGQKE